MPKLSKTRRFDRFTNPEEAQLFAAWLGYNRSVDMEPVVFILRKHHKVIMTTDNLPSIDYTQDPPTVKMSTCGFGVAYNSEETLLPEYLYTLRNAGYLGSIINIDNAYDIIYSYRHYAPNQVYGALKIIGFDMDAVDMLNHGIPAIKKIRKLLGSGLRESKGIYDYMASGMRQWFTPQI